MELIEMGVGVYEINSWETVKGGYTLCCFGQLGV